MEESASMAVAVVVGMLTFQWLFPPACLFQEIPQSIYYARLLRGKKNTGVVFWFQISSEYAGLGEGGNVSKIHGFKHNAFVLCGFCQSLK